MRLPLSGLFLPALLIALSARAGGSAGHIIPGWGRVIEPDGDCTITTGDGKVTVAIPGTTHDLSSYHSIYKKRNAPRILQEVDGDFMAQVKVSGTFDPGKDGTLPGAHPFNGAGLLLWDNDENYLRLERNVWTMPHGEHSSYLPLFEYWKDDQDLTQGAPSTKPFFTGRSAYLRLTRQGNQVRAAVSNNGVDWVETNPVTVQFPEKISVGVDAINTSKQPFTVEFTEFKLVSEKMSLNR
jgi:regulation of enolase protein 1 (concanavalin A-like superfamily)